MALDLILFTPPETKSTEIETVLALLDAGVDKLHVRKPGMGKEEFLDYLKEIPARYYRKVVIHSHYDLISKYNLGGIHFTNAFLDESSEEQVKELVRKVRERRITLSTSLHHLSELEQLPRYFDYVFLSPIFDSISKADYASKFDLGQVKKFLSERSLSKPLIYALGGIFEGNVEQIKDAGFNGAAVLGGIWNSNDPLESFQKIDNLI